jgi:hypothetical protein
VANQKKRSSLTEAFWGVVSRRGSEAPVTETEKPGTRKEPDAEQVDVVPGKGGQPIAANTPVDMTFTVTAKERYEWTLELRRRGLSALSVLRGAMNELLKDGKG